MAQHVSHLDKHSVPRRSRFSDRFKDDITTIVSVVTAEIGTILVKQHKVRNTMMKVHSSSSFLSQTLTCSASGLHLCTFCPPGSSQCPPNNRESVVLIKFASVVSEALFFTTSGSACSTLCSLMIVFC